MRSLTSGAKSGRLLRTAAWLAGLAAVYWAFASLVGPRTVGSGLVSLGLDQERAGLVLALLASLLIGAICQWAAGLRVAGVAAAAYFTAGYLVPTLVGGLPSPIAGERLSLPGLAAAAGSLVALATAMGLVGGAISAGVRWLAAEAIADLASHDAWRIRRTATGAALAAVAAVAIW